MYLINKFSYIKLEIIFVITILFISSTLKTQPIDDLIKSMLVKDETINSSKFMVKKADNELASTRSLFTPKLDLSIPLGKEFLINNDSANTDMNYYEFNAKITQNLYDFGETSSKYTKAKNKLKLAEISQNNTKSNKLYEALVAYLNYIKAYKVLDYSKQSELRIKNVTNLENEKVKKGAGLASNVLQSKARLAGAKSVRVRFQGDLDIATNRFYNVFREMPSSFDTFSVPILPVNMLPKTEAEAIKIAKENNIALSLSKLNLKNSKNNIKSKKSKFFPSVKAIAEYKNKRNSSGLDGTEVDYIYKLEMKYPISIGGPYGLFYKENSDYKASVDEYMASKYNLEKLERNLEESIRNAWQTKIVSKQNYEYLNNQANISGEFFKLAMKEVKLGNRQLIDILSSETAYINAKSSAESAQTDYQLAVYQLLLSIGILDEKLINQLSKRKIEKKTNNIKKNLELNKKETSEIRREAKTNGLKKANMEIKKENKKDIQISSQKLKIDKNIENLKEESKIILQKKIEGPLVLTEDKNNILDEIEDIKPTITNKLLASKDEKNMSFFKIQLGAFNKIDNAERLIEKVNNSSFDYTSFNLEKDNLTNLYKVKSIDGFEKKEALIMCNKFTSKEFGCTIAKN